MVIERVADHDGNLLVVLLAGDLDGAALGEGFDTVVNGIFQQWLDQQGWNQRVTG